MSNTMDCPKCIGKLELKEYDTPEGNSVAIDICWSCEGIWCDKGELEKLRKVRYKIVDPAPFWSNPEHHNQKKVGVKCPRCETPMDEEPSSVDKRLILDKCPKCQGIWLDGGELGLLLRGGAISRIFGLLGEIERGPFPRRLFWRR